MLLGLFWLQAVCTPRAACHSLACLCLCLLGVCVWQVCGKDYPARVAFAMLRSLTEKFVAVSACLHRGKGGGGGGACLFAHHLPCALP